MVLVLLLSSFSVAAQPRQGGTLTIGRPTDAISLDPHKATTAGEVWVYNNIIEPLVRMNHDMELEPALATNWERIGTDRLRFYLRQGVKFHDGTPFNAEAVKFSVERAIDPKSPARGRSWIGPVIGAEVIDEYTVDIITDGPYGPLLHAMSMVFVVGIVSPTAVEKYGDQFGRNPVGTGPFKFVEWVPDNRIVLERNDDYWGGAPHLDRVIFRVIPEEGARMVAFETGEIDMMLVPPPHEINRLRNEPDVTIHQEDGLRMVYVGMHMQHPPLDDHRVRQAIFQAIDIDSIVEFITEGVVTRATTPLAPGVLGYVDVEMDKRYPYDPDAALELLAEAGWVRDRSGRLVNSAGEQMELTFFLGAGRDLKDAEIAEAVQAQLAEIGMDVRLERMEWGAYLAALVERKDQYHLFNLGWLTVTADGDFGLNIFMSENIPPVGTNRFHYVDERFDELLIAARTELDQALRAQYYNEALELLARDIPLIPIYYTREYAVARSYVQGYRQHPVEYYMWMQPVWLNK